MGVWVSVPFVMDGKIHAHSFGNKLLAAEIPYKGGVLVDVYKRQTRHREQVIVQLPAGRGHVYHKEGQKEHSLIPAL